MKKSNLLLSGFSRMREFNRFFTLALLSAMLMMPVMTFGQTKKRTTTSSTTKKKTTTTTSTSSSSDYDPDMDESTWNTGAPNDCTICKGTRKCTICHGVKNPYFACISCHDTNVCAYCKGKKRKDIAIGSSHWRYSKDKKLREAEKLMMRTAYKLSNGESANPDHKFNYTSIDGGFKETFALKKDGINYSYLYSVYKCPSCHGAKCSKCYNGYIVIDNIFRDYGTSAYKIIWVNGKFSDNEQFGDPGNNDYSNFYYHGNNDSNDDNGSSSSNHSSSRKKDRECPASIAGLCHGGVYECQRCRNEQDYFPEQRGNEHRCANCGVEHTYYTPRSSASYAGDGHFCVCRHKEYH